MRTRHPVSIVILLALSALVATSCDTGPVPLDASGAARPAEPGSPTPLATGLGTTAPATALASPDPFVAADVLAANTVPWPVKSIRAGSGICSVGLADELRCWAGEAEAPPRGSFSAVDPGEDGPCGIKTSGELTCWGRVETRPPKGQFVALASAAGWRCAIRTNGEVACWPGYDMGEGTASRPDTPEGQYTEIAVSALSTSCALRVDGTVVCWSNDEDVSREIDGVFISLGSGCGLRDTGELECFESSINDVVPILPEGPFVRMSGGPDGGCAIRVDGSVACWGLQGYDPETEEPLPVRAPAGTWADVSVSEYFTCATRADGQAACWGTNDEQARPGPVARLEVPVLSASPRVEVTWSGVPQVAPISSFDLEYSHRDPFAVTPDDEEPSEPAWVRWLDRTTDSSATLETTGGGIWCFRARARDADAITGGWQNGTCASVAIDDRELEASGDWTRVEGEPYAHGTALRTTTKGATIRITMGDAASVGILGTRCGGCGTFVLGQDEVDLKGPFEDSVMVVAANNGQEGYSGPIDIVVTSSGKPVIIDAVYLNLETE